MRPSSPQRLTELLGRLKLCAPDRLRGMGWRVRRLAWGLPTVESVWVDALVQARILTHFQADEIHAGRGEALRVGPYVLCRPLPSPGYVASYLAREIDSSQMVRLAVFAAERPAEKGDGHPLATAAEPDRTVEVIDRLESLAAKAGSLDEGALAPVIRVGRDGDRLWAAGRHVPGRTAAEWMVCRGRFPPTTVLHIARQMTAVLERLEASGLCHGDIHAHGLVLPEGGNLVLPQPGLRPILHPKEGPKGADLPPEAYDGVAPERITEGAPASLATDVYACASLWWHLLTGRAPVPGATREAKLAALPTARIPDVRDLAPDTPDSLAAAIASGLQRDPGARPDSMARLGATLGPASGSGCRALKRHLSRAGRLASRGPSRSAAAPKWKPAPAWLLAIAATLLAVAAVGWSAWRPGNPSVSAGSFPGPAPGPAETAHEQAMADNREPAPPNAMASNDRSPESELLPEERIDELVLSGGGPLRLEARELRPGLCVRGEPGCRPLVLVPPGGLAIVPDGVRFENVDFVWEPGADAAPRAHAGAAILDVSASRVEFRGCAFRASEATTPLPVAIRWTDPVRPEQAELSLLSGLIRLHDCVLERVGAAVACQIEGTPVVEMANVLHLGPGPLVQLDRCREADEPVLVGLANVTLREAGPLLECRYGRIPDRPGSISIQADGCVLAIRPQTPLLRFVGPDRPERLLDKIQWSGQGSLVLPDAMIAAWQRPGGELLVLDDAGASIAGLVQSRVQFAGAVEAGPQASRIVSWQAPLQSPNPPGIDARLPGAPRR